MRHWQRDVALYSVQVCVPEQVGAVSGQSSEVRHWTQLPPTQYGVAPLHAGVHVTGAASVAASTSGFCFASVVELSSASGIVPSSAAVRQMPELHRWPERH
jgi:hypothetical protein